MTTEHPQRCDTCQDINCYLCPLLPKPSDGAVELQLELVRRYISRRGCASHKSTVEPEHKFTCLRGGCKLHDSCIRAYDINYPPCVGAYAQRMVVRERERILGIISTRLRSAYFFFDDVKFDETIESIRAESIHGEKQEGEY